MRRPRTPVPPAYRFAASILRPTMRALTRHEWRGAQNLPATGGFLVCSNHLSYVDPISLRPLSLRQRRPPHYLAKHEVFDVPGIGAILRNANQIPVYRESAPRGGCFRAAVGAVQAGRCVVVYPEGTLTRDPGLWPMTGKTGAARIALATRCPVVPSRSGAPQEMLVAVRARGRASSRARRCALARAARWT